MPNPCLNPPCDTLVPIEDTFMVWQVPMLPDFTYGFSASPLLLENKLIYTNKITVAGEPINVVSKLTGKLIWRNENMKSPSSSSVPFYLNGSKLAFLQNYILNYWDIQTGNKIWEINFRDNPNANSFSNLSGFGNIVFTSTTQYNSNNKDKIANLVKVNLDDPEIDTLFTITNVDGYTPDIEPPATYVDGNGDTLLIFQCRLYNFPKIDGRIDFYCFNMTQKKIEWFKKDIEESGTGTIFLPQIVGDRVYYQGSNEVFMFDIATGAKIWSRRFPGESYYLTKHIIAENKIFMYNDGVGLRALDLNSGLTIWENNDANYDGGLVGGLCYHNSNIYFIGGDEGYAAIFGLRADTGKQFWKYRTPNYKKYPKSTFGYINMISDPETGYLYTGDGVFMMCLKPPK